MYQGTLKSAVRRSLTKSLLLPSDDVEDSVRSRAFGTPKSAAAEFPSGRTRRGRDPAAARAKEEERAVAYRNSNDSQLLQVSREAHKLSQMIDSWSKETSIGSRSQFFAEDLLRGAIDLQESLDMLQKLQDASKKMSRVKVMGKREGNASSARKLGYRGFAAGNERHIMSDDFSRNCVEELKQVINESLHKRNVFSSSSDDGKSSSNRSMRYSAGSYFEDKYLEQNGVPAEPVCSTSQPKNGKSSNLIAKLMGLEEVPPVKKEERKLVNLTRPRFDIDLPKARRTHFFSQNNEQRERLDELVEATHYRGLLKQSQVEENGFEPPFFSAREHEQYGRNLYRADQLPPIVIMKPLHLRYQGNKLHEEHPVDEVSTQENIQEIKLVQESNSVGYHFKTSVDYNKHNVLAKSQEQKNLKNADKGITESTLPNHETPSSLYQKEQRKRVNMANRQNADEQKSSRINVKRQEEKGIKATRTTMSNPKTPSVQAKHNKEQPIARTNASIVQNPVLKSLLRSMPKASADSSKDKNILGVKPVRKSAIPTTDGRKFNENGTTVKTFKKVNDVPKSTGIFESGSLLQPAKQELKPYPDNLIKDQELFCEAIPRNSQCVGNYKSTDQDVVPIPECKKVVGAAGEFGDDLKNIFLSSQSFLSCAKKLFSIDVTQIISLQRRSTDMIAKCDSKVFLDVSLELMSRKYYLQELSIHPLMIVQSWSRIACFSIDKLVEEISVGIRKLTSYYKFDSLDTSEGSLLIRLERELMSKDTAINSVWDIGWDQLICLEDADQIVDEVGREMLSWLIEEIALELI